ncbi:MAG: tetratricopeptide repeat protein [Caulobacteraceae bacterium]|nr:tetratricopeptide repeat protein [Caulobacteraceae bacterium]
MAEDLLGGLLGGEPEGGEEEAPESRIAAEAFAAALAADHAKYDPGVARAAERFLDKQARLLDAQTAEIEEQRPLRLRHLENQSREAKLRRAGQRIRLAMQVFVGLALTVLGLGVLMMLQDAFNSRSVVVEAFKSPSALAGRGLTGDVVAENVLDALQKMQEATRIADKGMTTRGAWDSDVRIEVPETGVSIGEINRLLHERFGHDLHIGGELVQTATGDLALTVRGDGVPAATFTGEGGDLQKLTQRAAEYVYGRSQPSHFAAYLNNQGRLDDEAAFLAEAFPRAETDADRALLANIWGISYSGLSKEKLDLASSKFRLSMSFSKPRTPLWWRAWGNLVGSMSASQGEEAGWRESRAMLAAAAAAPASEQPDLLYVANTAQLTWDLPRLLAANLKDATLNGGAGTQMALDGPQIADVYALMHDPVRSARYIATSDPADPITKAEILLLQGYASLDRGDPASAVAPLEAFYREWLANNSVQYTYNDQPCFTALAYGLVGRLPEAEAIFKKIGPWSRCDAFHGDVLAHAGDVAGAERAWAEGTRAAPDLAPTPLHRGLFELGRGDLAAAEADTSLAAAKAPHWADPWKAWGDVLAREGRWKEALAKYDEALKYAPAWVELHQARDVAARHAG